MTDQGSLPEDRVDELFEEVVDLSPAERQARLEPLLSTEPGVVAEVRRLLDRLDVVPEDFLDPRHEPKEATTADPLRLPEEIGGYRILRVLGEGGMGSVYEAEQTSPRRRVALKVIRSELASDALLRRFALEAELLGQLRHPGIAHVYESGDAGSPGRPRPFFAMELVEGVPLDEHLELESPSLRQRLELIARVADAVQHAHQKGIVHRDLKPANILVVKGAAPPTQASDSTFHDDDIGQPKVLDFGIARVAEPENAMTIQTHAGQIIGTLAYMSPEQVAGDSSQLDTRCDVYALGVLLYESLVGQGPLPLQGLSLVEAVRVIQEDEPTAIDSLDRSLRGDVATIVEKALEKDRDRRYGSASELAADIRRFLNDQPIEARPASTLYQLKKFARRNRALVGGVVATIFVLILGLAGTGYYLAESKDQARAASQTLAQLRLREKVMEKKLYATQMILGGLAVNKAGRLGHVREILEQTERVPRDSIRGWEWFYLLAECHRERWVAPLGVSGEAVAWHPDGTRYLVGGYRFARLVDAETQRVVWKFDWPKRVAASACWSPDGAFAALISSPGEVSVVETASGAIARRLSLEGHVPRAVDWSPDGMLLTTGSASEIVVWSASDGSVERRIPVTEPASTIEWSADGLALAFCSAGQSRRFDVLNLETEEIRSVSTVSGLEEVRWRPDGARLAYLTNGGGGGVVDAVSLETVYEFEAQRGYVQALAWSADGERLAAAGPNGVILVFDDKGEGVATFGGHTKDVAAIDWHPTEPRLLSVSGDETAREWEADSGEFVFSPTRRECPAMDVAWSPDGRSLVTAHQRMGAQLWDTEALESVGSLTSNPVLCWSVSWSQCGRFAAVCEAPEPVRIWHAASRSELKEIGPAGVTLCAWSPHEAHLATLDNRRLSVWSVGDGNEEFRYEFEGAYQRRSPLAWHPEKRRILVVSADHRVLLIDLDSTTIVRSYSYHEQEITDLSWSPSGNRFVAACEDGELTLWNVDGEKPSQQWVGHASWPVSVDWSPDGTRIASAGEDHSLRLWDANDATSLIELTGHGAPLRRVRWSRCGRRLATVDAHGRCRVWDARAGYERASDSDHSPTSAAVRPDDQDPPSLAELRLRARSLELLGQPEEAEALWAHVATEYTRRASEDPTERNLDARRRFRLERLEHDSRDRWRVMSPVSERSTAARVVRQADGSYVVAGKVGERGEVYELDVQTNLSRVVALRLEAIPDLRLPSSGASWDAKGVFEVVAVEVELLAGPNDGSTIVPCGLRRAASYPRGTEPLVTSPESAWRGQAPATDREVRYLELLEPVVVGQGDRLRIRLANKRGHELSRFRLSASSDLEAFAQEVERLELELELEPGATPPDAGTD